jgi:hypothetical protein
MLDITGIDVPERPELLLLACAAHAPSKIDCCAPCPMPCCA